MKQTETSLQKAQTQSKESENSCQQYLEAFIAGYNNRTKISKQIAQTYRPVLADPRVSEGFNLPFKEMCYPIVGKRSQGSRIWDIDGNEYIDLMMGFGVNLFGHNPPFIKAALAEQLEQGIQLGPQSEFAGEVAELICQLTGMERVAFSNTGTEAVMTAIRLARTATGRNKIALFSGSYHGHFDGTLVKAQTGDGNPRGVAIAPGIPPNIVEDVLVLDYGNPQSLEVIEAHRQELAAILVVPVQTMRPDLQPKMFLQQLRQLTKESGITLIFDEMVIGFRIHPGGAQAWFDVEADIATYGKIVGGGMPIGVIAGKALYMDAIDGGMWNYGDLSYPEAKTTFFAGTFCKHPLAIAASRAVVKHLKTQGPALQQQLNQRTSQFVAALNAYFEEDEVPIRMANFGSLFGPATLGHSGLAGNSAVSQSINLLRYHLMYRGVLLLGGGGYLSTAHTNEDIDCIIQAVKDSVAELRSAGFLPPLSSNSSNASSKINHSK
ncbi:aspartate aminotransferase family protein [Microseira wollei]|uniref:Aminotransferase class-III n=1 Tax=Microseira wollei NIES-4236 TaxID=2530354 RepID=A0AAV3XND8_9CYAN|nr:aspartate aminotransferase family protein [Microseira wollei]GET42311.1 aminotransferase class-III [Microseira wollei NIES-4236]